MHLNSIALLALYASFADAHWWWKTHTVTVTHTQTQTVKQCTQKCSSFGSVSCTSTTSKPQTKATSSISTRQPTTTLKGSTLPCTSKHISTTSTKGPTTTSKTSTSNSVSQRFTTLSTASPKTPSTTSKSSTASSLSRSSTTTSSTSSRSNTSKPSIHSTSSSLSSTSRKTSTSTPRSGTNTPKTATSSSTPKQSTSPQSHPTISSTTNGSSATGSSTSRSTTSSQNHLTTSPTSNRSSSASTNSLTLPSPSSSTPANGGNDGCSTPPTNEFYLRATTPQLISQGQYAVISPAGAIVFTAASPNDAAKFSLSTTNHLIHASKYAQIVPGTTSQVQFVSSACDLSKRSLLESRQAAPEPLTCIVTAADGTGAPLIQCGADAALLQQACGTGFYLGPAPAECQPLVLAAIPPDSPSATTNTPTRANGAPSQMFSLQANPDFASQPDTVQFYGGYASLPNSGGLTGFAFSIFYHGAPLSLDADGHLVGVGPAPQGVAGNVAYAATFQIGSTFGPIAMMYGEIMAGYAPIVCRIPPGFDAGDGPVYSLQCTDGALGTLMTLQKCGSGNLFYLGDRVHTEDGCVAAFFRVYYTGN